MTHDEHDTVGRFRDRSADYVKYRPTYPAAAVDAILDGLGSPRKLIAADVGAGTGISARLLGDRGVRVVAIEPGNEMRAAAAPHPMVEWIAARAEATGLRSRSVDLVLCAQSFHWFPVDATLREFARILKDGGRLVLMWNRQNDALTAAYRGIMVDVAGAAAEARRHFDSAVIGRSGLFSPAELLVVPNAQRMDLDGLIGRARSASYAPKSGHAGERMLAQLQALHQQHADANGIVTFAYDTQVFRSVKL